MTFSLTPKTAFPRPQADGFPQGIQWEADGTPLGDRHVQTVNLVGFGSGGVTRDEDTLTIVGSGGGGGASPSPSSVIGASVRKTASQSSGTVVLFQSAAAPGFNTGGMSATGVYTVAAGQAGIYRCSASVRVDNGNSENAAFVEVGIVISAAPTVAYGYDARTIPALGTDALHPYCEIALAVGDQVDCRNMGAAWSGTLSLPSVSYTRFTVVRVGDTP